MSDDRKESEIAEALAMVQGQRARGENPDLDGFRARLGDSHAEFVDLVHLDSMIDDYTDPPAPENLPREFGDYTLLRELGQGAIGIVYEADQRSLSRRVAVKTLKPPYDRDPEARARFRDEAKNAAKVRHPHIIEIFDKSEVGGNPFYSMEILEGRPLSALIASDDVGDPRKLCRQLAGIADGLSQLHRLERPIVHRDVKPLNIMVRPDGHMKLLDFGLAREGEGSGTRTGVGIGSPHYMPPEQMAGRKHEIDGLVDVYALGVTLYEAIARRPIFDAKSYPEIYEKVVAKAERPARLRSVAPACLPAIEKIAMKAIENARADRYATMAAMRDDLLAVADGKDEQVRGEPVSQARRVLRWIGSPVGLAAAASTLLAIGAGLWWTGRPGRLEVKSLPGGAEVWIAGRLMGHTPLSIPLKAGSYDVVVKRELFQDVPTSFDVAAGGSVKMPVPMQFTDPNNPVARLLVSQGWDADVTGYKGERSRGDGPSLVFVYPRDNVRKQDLDSYGYEFDYANAPDAGGNLVFRRGNEVLHTEPFASEPKRGSNKAPFPKHVRDQLRVGDVVTWGLRYDKSLGAGPGRKNVLATFVVVPDDTGAELEAFRADVAKAGYPASFAGELDVRKLMKMGLLSAALARADQLADEHPEDGALQALAKLAHVRLKITESVRMSDLNERIDRLPKAVRERLEAATIEEAGSDGAAAPESPEMGR